MTATILLTGFGPFPGAPFNPTGALVRELARRPFGGARNMRCITHVFPTSYKAVDRELPAIIARERPAALIMFGLAARSRHIRIETRARNVLTGRVADASGHLPASRMIAPGERATLRLRASAQVLVAAVRAAGLSAALSRDAGDYVCNYLCWRAGTAAVKRAHLRLIAFVHVPKVRQGSHRVPRPRRALRGRQRPPATFVDLLLAGEAILRAVQAALLTD